MEVLKILNDKLILGESVHFVTELFSNEMYKKALDLFNESDCESVFSNELFQRYAVSYVALKDYINRIEVNEIEIDDANLESIVPWLIMDIIRSSNLQIKVKWKCSNSAIKTSPIYTVILGFLAGIKLMTEMLVIKRTALKYPEKQFAIVRSKAAKGKISHIDDIEILYERLEGGPSVYGLFSLSKRLFLCIKALVHCNKYRSEQRSITRRTFGKETVKNARYYYSLRNVHTCLYALLIEEVFKKTGKRVFVSGNNLDRYAIVEEKAAKKRGVSTVCIPHGLEYGFKLPHCFTGDIFYATSEYAAEYLNRLYHTKKFVFDQELMTSVYQQQPDHHHGVNRIIFFTEPTENYVNREILDNLHIIAQKIDCDVWVKLHPKDERKNYEGISYIRFDDNYSDAICDNICIARKSTTLLEATYNNSKPCAVILIGKDEIEFSTFPSLQSPLIHVAKTKEQLEDFIMESLKP